MGSDSLLKLCFPSQFRFFFEKNKGMLDRGMLVPQWNVSVSTVFIYLLNGKRTSSVFS